MSGEGPPPGGNGTANCKDYDDVHTVHLVWHSLVLALGLPLNGVALWVFLCYFPCSNKTVVYMVNLATCDLLFTLSLPLRIYYYAWGDWPLGDVPCQVAGSLFQINQYGSCLFLACINVDRLLALAYPLRARHLRRPKVAWQACAAVWAVIVLGCVPVALAHDTSRCLDGNGTVQLRCFESFSRRAWRREILPLVLLQFLLGFLLPLVTVLYCTARALRALSRAADSPGPGKRRKAMRLLLSSTAIFVVCFLPYNVALLVYTSLKAGPPGAAYPGQQARARWALQLAMLPACANCCLDPLVYYFSTEGFRKTFRAKGTVRSEETRERWISLSSRKSRRVRGRRPPAPAGGDPPEEELLGLGNGSPPTCPAGTPEEPIS
ncbi:lysophosphatidic acid receptor 5-like [Heterodontus francisci]|uniref:lysophosphatidic acid receptor 5-like n=1 Tax=Heterodontus francisci TaxID=7792 RepID=UPI00355C49C7